MSKVALAAALGMLLFFTYLTAIRPAYAFAYALCLLFVVAWAWPRVAIRGMSLTRRLDPGTPTVGESYDEGDLPGICATASRRLSADRHR